MGIPTYPVRPDIVKVFPVRDQREERGTVKLKTTNNSSRVGASRITGAYSYDARRVKGKTCCWYRKMDRKRYEENKKSGREKRKKGTEKAWYK